LGQILMHVFCVQNNHIKGSITKTNLLLKGQKFHIYLIYDHDPGVEQCKQHLEKSPKELFFCKYSLISCIKMTFLVFGLKGDKYKLWWLLFKSINYLHCGMRCFDISYLVNSSSPLPYFIFWHLLHTPTLSFESETISLSP
jgi:hypothetical protein